MPNPWNFERGFSDLADGLIQAHREHQDYDEKLGNVKALQRLIWQDPTGQLVVNPPLDDKGKPLNKDLKSPFNPQALQNYENYNRREAATKRGEMNALSRVLAAQVLSGIEDASLSGQRTKQIMQQQEQMFPLEMEAKKAGTAHVKKIVEDADKIMVPGYGMMTPSQLSQHNARMERIKTLQEKTDPARSFETDLQKTYGLSIPDILDATKGMFTGGSVQTLGQRMSGETPKGVTYKGVPFVDAAGNQVPASAVTDPKYNYKVKAPTIWAVVGPNQAQIPAHLWPQIVSKSKSFASQLDLNNPNSDISQLKRNLVDTQKQQAQEVISIYNSKPADQRTPQDEEMYKAAQQVMGQ